MRGSTESDDNNRPYRIQDLMVLHNLSRRTVIRLYENEPGVLVLQNERPGVRRRRTIRVPPHVYARVKNRLAVK
jgi:hypothetical protein